MSDFNIYDDLELLHAQQKQKEGEELQWKEKYHVALETIQKLQVEKKDLNKKIKQLEINFASLLDTARTEIKRKDNQINQLRREKDDICFRRNVRPIKKHSVDEDVIEDGKRDGGYVNPFSIDLKSTAPKSAITLSKPVDEKNKTSTSRQRNGECEEKDNRSTYREPRSESSRERGRDRDRSRHMSREENRRKDDRDLEHRRDRYDRTSSQVRSSDSSRETTEKGQSTHSHRAGYKDSNPTKFNICCSSSSKYETHLKGKRETCAERRTYKEKETRTAKGRSDDGLKEKVPPIEKIPPKENTDNGKSSALEKEILNDVKQMKKAKQSETENEAQSQINAVKARTEKSNNFLDALFDDMVLNGDEEQTNDLYNDLPLETVVNDKIELKEIGPKTDENCNVEPIMQTPLKQRVTTLLDDLFGPSPANSAVSAAVGRRNSLSTVGESSDAVSSDEVEFVPIVSTAAERNETKKSVVVSDLAINVSSAQFSKANKPMTDEVQKKSLPQPVSEPKAFQFVELDSSFYSSDEDDKTDNVDVRESQSDIDSPPFEKCQLLRSDFESKEQTNGVTIETHFTEGFHKKMTSVKDSHLNESVLTTAVDDVKKDQCRKLSSLENPCTTEIACDPSAKNAKKKCSPQKDSHKHHHSSKHAKSSRSSSEKHRHRSERLRREEEKHRHHRHHRSSKESTKSIHHSEKKISRSVGNNCKDTTNAPKEKNLKESEVQLVWSEDTEDQTPAQEKQTAVHEDTSSDLKLYHDQVIALQCDDVSDEEGVEADPPKIPEAGTHAEVPRTLEDLVISLQCEDLSDEDEVQFVVETNNLVASESEMQAGSENFVAEPFDCLNYEEGELMESHVKFTSMEQAIASNNVVLLLNNEETQSSANNGEMVTIFVQDATADMNQLCQSMFPKSTADEPFENRKETTASEPTNPACLQIESEDSPSEPTNSLPLVLSQEQPSSQDSTDVFSSGGRRKKVKTPRKNTNAGSILNHSSATDLKAMLPHRWAKSDDEYGVTMTKQTDTSNCHPRRRQSTSNLEEAATVSGKERIRTEVTHYEEADGTVLHKPCLIVEEELQKDMSPLWVEEESTEATIGHKVAPPITSEEQSDVVMETMEREDFQEVIVNKKRNRENDDEALVTSNDIEIHKQKRIRQVPSAANIEEAEALIVSESSTDSTAVFASKNGRNVITTDAEVAHRALDSIVMTESVVTTDSMQHVTEAGSSLVDDSGTTLDGGMPNAFIECEAINNEFVQKSIDLDVNDNQKAFPEPSAMGDNQKKAVEDEKQVAACGNSRKRRENTTSSCDKEPVVLKTTDDKEVAKDNQKESSLKDAAKRGRKNKIIKEPNAPKSIVANDPRTSKLALDSAMEQPLLTSGNDGVLTSNILRCVVKLPILPVFSRFDGKNSDTPLNDNQQVATSDGNRTLNRAPCLSEENPILPEGNVETLEPQVATTDSNSKPNSKLVQDAPLSNEKQDTLPLSDVKRSEPPLSDEQQVATSDTSGKPNKDHFQNSTHSDGNPPTSTDLSRFIDEKSKSAPTAEQQVPTIDQTSRSVLQHSTTSDEKLSILPDYFDSETLQTDEQRVTTSETVLPNVVDSDEKKTSPVDNNTAAETVTTSDDKSTCRASLTQNPCDLDSARENNKKSPPSDQSTNSLTSACIQPDATNTHIKKYKKRILNSFNNSKLSAGEDDKRHSSGSEIETLVTSSKKRKRTKAIIQDSSDSAGDATIEGVQSSAVQSPSASGNKTKQRKTNVTSNANSQPEFDIKNIQTEQIPTATSKNSPTSGSKQKHGRRYANSGKKDNKVEKTNLEHSTYCDTPQAVPADTQQMDQQKASIAKRKYKKRSSLDHTDSETHRPTVVATSDGTPIESPAKTSAAPCSEDIQNPIPVKSSQQSLPVDQQDISNCTINSNVPSSNESHDDRESNAIYIKRKIKPNKHTEKRRKCSTSSSDTINIRSESQSKIPSSNVSDVQPSPTTTEKSKLSLSTPAVTPTHHKIFNDDVYPEEQPPPEYNANGDDIQYQEIDNRMRSIFQSPTYPHTTTTCVELQVDISKGDVTIEETLLPGESSQCDTSSSSRKISVGSNDYVIETVGAHTANVFVTRKKCKKRTKAAKMDVP